MTQQLVMVKGIPGSGKSYWAKLWVDKDPLNRVRINMDDLRGMVYSNEDIYRGYGSKVEVFIAKLCNSAVQQALQSGLSVVVDNLNLGKKNVKRYRSFAKQAKAEFIVHEMDTPLEVCIERNANRERQVPEHRIRQIWEQHYGK